MRKYTCNVSLDHETVSICTELGAGNLSAGIRKMASLAQFATLSMLEEELKTAIVEQRAHTRKVKELRAKYKQKKSETEAQRAELAARQLEQEQADHAAAQQAAQQAELEATQSKVLGSRYGQPPEFLALVDEWWSLKDYRWLDDERINYRIAMGSRGAAQRMQYIRQELTKMKRYKWTGAPNPQFDFPFKQYLTPAQVGEYNATRPKRLPKYAPQLETIDE